MSRDVRSKLPEAMGFGECRYFRQQRATVGFLTPLVLAVAFSGYLLTGILSGPYVLVMISGEATAVCCATEFLVTTEDVSCVQAPCYTLRNVCDAI